MRRDIRNGEVPMKKLNRSRDQVLNDLRSAYEGGASIRTLVATTGRSYGSIHSMLRESGTTMRSRGGPNHRSRRAS
jgi:Helix-turn-helix domain